MNYSDTNAGRIAAEASAGGSIVTFADVEARLVEALRCWRRMPGGGRWPFAADGPWHLIRKEWADWDARDPAPLRRLPLRRDEIAAMEEATEWLRLVPDRDRRIVVLALLQLAAGRRQVSWSEVKRRLGVGIGARGVGMRYRRAISNIAKALSR